MRILIFIFLLCTIYSAQAQPRIGIVASLEDDSLVYASGYRFMVESVSKLVSPSQVSDLQFDAHTEQIKKLNASIYALNIFIPADLKLVGPSVNQDQILTYAETVFARCQKLGIKLIVWGSGGARRVPDGFDKSIAKAQFVDIAKQVSILARKYKVILALENLNSTETNFINTLSEALEMVKAVNHSNFKLCADIYHMLKENESATSIERAKKYLVHCDIAEMENRTPPGTMGDDFSPYLRALKKIGYSGKIILECRWSNLALQAEPARVSLQNQMHLIWNKLN